MKIKDIFKVAASAAIGWGASKLIPGPVGAAVGKTLSSSLMSRGGSGTGAVIQTNNKLHYPGVTFYSLNSSGHGGVYTAYCQLSPATQWGANNPGILSQNCLEMDSEI